MVMLAASVVGAQKAQPPGLEAELRGIIGESGAEVAVAFKTLDGADEVLIDPDKPFHAASTMKVPVMIELFRQARGRRVSRSTTRSRSRTSSTASSTAALHA